MRQVRITTADLLASNENDCYLAPDDPIHEFKKISHLGGLGSSEVLARYNNLSLPKIHGSDKGKIAREHGIEPGTIKWFTHWFARTTNENS